MISLVARQFKFIAESRSFAYIARQTGIPYRKVLSLRKGDFTLDDAKKGIFRNMYQREAYRRLRDAGMPVYEARRWSWYRPERVSVKTRDLHLKIADLAIGASAAKLRRLDLPTSKEFVDLYFDEMYDKIQQGIRTSIETTEVIMDYGKTN